MKTSTCIREIKYMRGAVGEYIVIKFYGSEKEYIFECPYWRYNYMKYRAPYPGKYYNKKIRTMKYDAI